jgi:hypothetical protein
MRSPGVVNMGDREKSIEMQWRNIICKPTIYIAITTLPTTFRHILDKPVGSFSGRQSKQRWHQLFKM